MLTALPIDVDGFEMLCQPVNICGTLAMGWLEELYTEDY